MLKLYILVTLITLGNAIWAMLNWNIWRKTIKQSGAVMLSADNLKQQAITLLGNAKRLSEKNSAEFRVCEQCGKIVQGICKECVSRIHVN